MARCWARFIHAQAIAPILVLLSLSVLNAAEPVLSPAPFAVPPSGTRLIFEDAASGQRGTGIVKKPHGLYVRWAWGGDLRESLTHFCTECANLGLDSSGGPLRRLYPLEKGKGVNFKITQGRDRVWDNELLVLGTERVETPAGTFDCFLVRRRSSLPDGSWRGQQYYWYAPSLGWVVRFESQDSTGKRQGWQLVDYD